MQSKEIISRGKLSFRELRKGNVKTKRNLIDEMGITWPTVEKVFKQLVLEEVVKEEIPNKMVAINPKYESFAGVYISEDTVEMSVIDFSGKEIYFDSKRFDRLEASIYALEEILKFKDPKIKSVAISSDKYLDHTDLVKFNTYLWLEKRFIREIVQEGVQIYFAKTCEANCLKWYEDTGNDKLNIIFSFFNNNCYYSIMKDGRIIQNIIYPNISKKPEDFYQNIIAPVWKAINPDNMIFDESCKCGFDWIKENILEWNDKIKLYHYEVNRDFDPLRERIKLIAAKYSRPSESAALYALYSYYGWT